MLFSFSFPLPVFVNEVQCDHVGSDTADEEQEDEEEHDAGSYGFHKPSPDRHHLFFSFSAASMRVNVLSSSLRLLNIISILSSRFVRFRRKVSNHATPANPMNKPVKNP
jgi:hypothetical protein